MKRVWIVLIMIAVIFGMGKACKNKPADNFRVNKAELGEDWSQFKHDASFNVWVFTEESRPQEHRTIKEARVFWNGDVTAEEKSLIDDGLTVMLAACKQDTVNWNPGNLWTKFRYFLQPPEYKLIFVQSNYELKEGEAAGCAGMITGAHGDCGNGTGTCSVAGVVGGLNDRVGNSVPGSKGGIYIIIPKQSPEQLARPACKMLLKNAVRNEAEHVFFTNSTDVFFATANDGVNGNHPYCRGNVPF